MQFVGPGTKNTIRGKVIREDYSNWGIDFQSGFVVPEILNRSLKFEAEESTSFLTK